MESGDPCLANCYIAAFYAFKLCLDAILTMSPPLHPLPSPPFLSFLQELVLEKETRLRESMKMMGLKSSALWCSWFVKQFLFLLITGLLVAIIMKAS